MDLIDSAVKSLRSLANERRERYLELIFYFYFPFFIFFLAFCLLSLSKIMAKDIYLFFLLVECKSYFSLDFYYVIIVRYIKMIPTLVPNPTMRVSA